MNDDRISWVKGDTQFGPLQTIGVLEIREDLRSGRSLPSVQKLMADVMSCSQSKLGEEKIHWKPGGGA